VLIYFHIHNAGQNKNDFAEILAGGLIESQQSGLKHD
jgi:hypothetical protein